jgi:hypothetical protein
VDDELAYLAYPSVVRGVLALHPIMVARNGRRRIGQTMHS